MTYKCSPTTEYFYSSVLVTFYGVNYDTIQHVIIKQMAEISCVLKVVKILPETKSIMQKVTKS